MKVSTYEEAKEYLESFIRPTVFARFEVDKHLADPLERMRYLLRILKGPQNNYPAVQISGTSGKGSTAYLISHILTTAGYRVGFTVSPHLEKINERIQINNSPIPDEELISLVQEVQPVVLEMSKSHVGQPSYFELLFALALLHFAKKEVDIVVAEVGLEGKYDGTNALHPLLAVLTNISLDHTRILGNTVEMIAHEATSMIKESGMDVVTGVTQVSVKEIVINKSKEVLAPITFVDRKQIADVDVSLSGSVFSFTSSTKMYKDLRLSLIGRYQLMNAALAIESIEKMQKHGFSVPESSIRAALSRAFFPGRFELVSKNPWIIIDGAHNPSKMEAFTRDVEELFPDKKKVFLVSFKEEKNIEEMVGSILKIADGIVVTEFTLPTDMQQRAAFSTKEIRKVIEASGSGTYSTIEEPSPEKALKKAREVADEMGAMLIVTGSLYLVGEVRGMLHR